MNELADKGRAAFTGRDESQVLKFAQTPKESSLNKSRRLVERLVDVGKVIKPIAKVDGGAGFEIMDKRNTKVGESMRRGVGATAGTSERKIRIL